MIGKTVSHYRILAQLGEGGMGVVYLAEDTHLGRRVAIKFATATHDKQQFRARFLREARAVSALSHTHIATLHDYGETPDGQQFIVMELVQGKNLSELLGAGSLSTEQAIEIIADVAEALSEAHSHGIVHRDIKPSNIMVNDRGQVKVLDFGLAKQIEEQRSASDPNAQTITGVHTRSDVVVGTLLYLSPEQATGSPVDGRSDLFALGAVLYECIAGRPPFYGANAIEVCAQVIHVDPPPPSKFNSLVTPELDHIALKALAKKPEARYQSADEVIADLRAARDRLDSAAELPTKRITLPSGMLRESVRTTFSDKLRRPRFSAFFFLAILLGALGVWFGLRYLLRSTPYTPPAEAQRLYQAGVAALRDGMYHKASKVLDNALTIDDNFALAHARLAEALTELDYADKGTAEMLVATTLVTDSAQLPPLDWLYLQAIGKIVKRDFPGAIQNYREIVEQSPEPDKAAAYLDLGRAYEKNDELDKAIESYLEATKRDAQSAAAFLRLGNLYGRKQDQPNAMQVLEKAEKIYRTLDYYEGVAEVLYQRGLLLNRFGKVAEARSQLQQALDITRTTESKYQQIRTMLQLSIISRVEGNTSGAKQYAEEAVELARANGLENLTTQGLNDIGNAYFAREEIDEAERYFKQALDFAVRNKGRRNEARALLSLGSLAMHRDKPDQAEQYVKQALSFYEHGGYSREVSLAFSILGYARDQRGQYDAAFEAFVQQLGVAKQRGNLAQMILAHEGAGTVFAHREEYRKALDHFEQEYSISKEAGDQLRVGYSLMNRGDILWRLGLVKDARVLLKEASLVAERDESGYKQLSARILLIYAQLAASERDLSEAIKRGREALSKVLTGHSAIEAKYTLGLAQALSGDKSGGRSLCEEAVEMAKNADNPRLLSTAMLALAEIMLESGETEGALKTALAAQETLARLGQQEAQWRSWLIAGRASHRMNDLVAAREYLAHANNLLLSVQQKLGNDFETYANRPDIQHYRKQLDEALALTQAR